jgi:hypothetical protein
MAVADLLVAVAPVFIDEKLRAQTVWKKSSQHAFNMSTISNQGPNHGRYRPE